jgi:hypothetical protein
LLMVVNHRYKICFYKNKNEYKYYNTIFGTILFDMIEEHNLSLENININFLYEPLNFFDKHIHNINTIQLDYITAFKKIFTSKWKTKLNKLAKNYPIPFNPEKTIVVHLRLDDKESCFVNDDARNKSSMMFKHMIDHNIHMKTYSYEGQSAMSEEKIINIIDKALLEYSNYEIVIITNGNHTLPYKTIYSHDENYDLYLLCQAKVLIGSMSTFSFAAMLFGDHTKVYYPLWEHAVCFGLTTKYDSTTHIELF